LTLLAIAVCVAVTAVALVAWGRAQKRVVDQDREVLDFGTIVQQFYAGTDITAVDVERAFTRISEVMGVPAGALRPDDRFDGELEPRAGWEYDDPIFIFSDELARDSANAGLTVKLEEVATVDDALRLMKRIATRGGANLTHD
jgi:hypothetical protein